MSDLSSFIKQILVTKLAICMPLCMLHKFSSCVLIFRHSRHRFSICFRLINKFSHRFKIFYWFPFKIFITYFRDTDSLWFSCEALLHFLYFYAAVSNFIMAVCTLVKLSFFNSQLFQLVLFSNFKMGIATSKLWQVKKNLKFWKTLKIFKKLIILLNFLLIISKLWADNTILSTIRQEAP